jgi:molybdate transport system regulatory protein
MAGMRLMVRIDFGAHRALGPGKIRLLETIDRTGSIAQAGRSLGMSYRRAWLLVDDLNRSFREPVVSKKSGGTRGGGAILTSFGRSLIGHYRAVEKKATTAAKRSLHELQKAVRSTDARKRLKRSIRIR